ncbi:GNAT family N-acetyltransferase [uncultured Umboniibacter sp.]|uniref:GNAT family N-acetyltransferase n=1 Tax=uncultured Umboniibacter sp. TaxID=1798917 RepID=UPI0026081C9C|nr:GNAT family N-acetyltransferase [uncultured Umboniibacter sp.]
MNDLRVIRVRWPEYEGEVHAIRHEVFVQEQGVAENIEWDGQDSRCVHVLAFHNETPVGTGRLMPSGKIGRMAVLKRARGKGIGALLLTKLVEIGGHAGFLSLYLHAQAHASGFYQRADFKVNGDSYLEAGIEHVTMDLALTPRDGPITPSAFSANRLQLVTKARRDVYIAELDFSAMSNDLADITAKLTLLLRENARAEIFILSFDSVALIERCPEFFNWLQRLNSRVHYRVLSEADAAELGASWLIPGLAGQFKQAKGLSQAAAGSPVLGTQLQRFKQIWERSRRDKRFRRLMI